MKFMYHILPAYPASPEERERLHPIAHRTDKTQQMLDEMLELTQFCEELGFDIVTFSEHHFYTEGGEAGATPTPHLIRLLLNTKRIMIGPLGFVLPTWDPIRLALDVAWADQMSKGRVVCGLARGIFPRWVNVLGQHYSVQPGVMGPEAENLNREVFEELYDIIEHSWSDEPFCYKGKFYQVPYPAEGHPWPPHEATARFGAPGEVVGDQLRKISPVPKPYQKPRPLVMQAFTASERTIRWDAMKGIVPIVSAPFPDIVKKNFEAYRDEAAKFGKSLRLGENIGTCGMIYLGRDRDDAHRLMHEGQYWVFTNFHAKMTDKIPPRVEGMIDAKMAVAGTVDDVRRRIGDIQDAVNPEYYLWQGDQGYLKMDDLKRELDMFANKVMPEFQDKKTELRPAAEPAAAAK